MDSPRSALITGGSTGLGLATAHHLAGLGLGVTITGRTRSTLDTALAELEAVKAERDRYQDAVVEMLAEAAPIEAEKEKK